LFYVELDELKKSIVVEMFYANNTQQYKYEYSIADSPITIGRVKCTIKVNSSICSKKHTTLTYSEDDECWYIADGHKTKKSTNGTWIMLDRKFAIESDSFFKMGANIFSVKLY